MKRLIILTFSFLILTTFGHYVLADGYSLKPGIKEYELSPGEVRLGEILFKSNEKSTTKITATVETYDPKTEEIINKKPFLALNAKEYSVKGGSEIPITYVISVPKDTPIGSYFNIITISEKTDSKNHSENSVGVKKAVGAIIAMHIIESQKSIEALFFDQGETSLKIASVGLPGLSETEIEYSYTNNSNFVFKPEGEIRVVDQQGKQVAQRFEINPGKKAIYPGDAYSEKFSIEKTHLSQILQSKDIIARTYSGYGNEYITDKVTLSLKNSAILTGLLLAVILLVILYALFKFLTGRTKRSEKS